MVRGGIFLHVGFMAVYYIYLNLRIDNLIFHILYRTDMIVNLDKFIPTPLLASHHIEPTSEKGRLGHQEQEREHEP